MRLCFIDFANWDYNVDAPTLGPLGGSQSALCYLSVALAKAGHDVTVMSGTERPGQVQGVECLHANTCDGAFFREKAYDAVIVLNSGTSSKLRAVLPSSTKLILWTQHEPAQPSMHRLGIPGVRSRWDGIVCVSDWQKAAYVREFNIAPERMAVIRNAIAPCFERLFSSRGDFANAKSNPLTLAYTSTPYRGLQLLLEIFPEFRREAPVSRLDVYSSMAVYRNQQAVDDEMQGIYDALKATAGVNYVGSLPQPQLAERLATAHILAYPCIFPETSCIAVMEAMAAGLRVVTSDVAALPETTEGFADLVPYNADFVRNYTEVLDQPYSPDGLFAQVVHMNQHHTWKVRAQQWAEYLNAA